MKRIVHVSALALSLGALTACSSSRATEEDYDDVAASMGALSSEGGAEHRAMSDGVILLRGDVPRGLVRSASGAYEGVLGNLAYSFELTCVDRDGDELLVCSESTDSGELTVSYSGELNVGTFSGSVEREGEWQVRDVTGEVARFDGDGHYEVLAEWRTLNGTVRSFQLACDAEYDAIAFRTSDRTVVSGEAHFAIEARRMTSRGANTTEAEVVIDAVLRFYGDGDATLVLDGDHTYSVNVETGAVLRVQS